MKKLTLAIDFDGTIVKDAYPEVGELQLNAKKRINQLKDDGHTIIIHTCREGKYKEQAFKFLKENEVHFDYLNENSPYMMEKYQNNSRKIGADVYVDDKSIFCRSIHWAEIYCRISSIAKEESE